MNVAMDKTAARAPKCPVEPDPSCMRRAYLRGRSSAQQASSLDVSADVSPPGFRAGRWRVSMISDAMTSVLDCARRE